jgi:hypothetical protein
MAKRMFSLINKLLSYMELFSNKTKIEIYIVLVGQSGSLD